MGEMTDTEKLYNILSNKLTWLKEYGEEVYLAAKEDIRSAIQEAEKTFDADKALIQLEILEEEHLNFDQAIFYRRKKFMHLSLKLKGKNRRQIIII